MDVIIPILSLAPTVILTAVYSKREPDLSTLFLLFLTGEVLMFGDLGGLNIKT